MSVCLSVCSLLRYRLTVLLPPLPEVGCLIFLEIRKEVVSDLKILVSKWSKIAAQLKKKKFFADFALQNMVEITLPDGLETSGRRVYR